MRVFFILCIAFVLVAGSVFGEEAKEDFFLDVEVADNMLFVFSGEIYTNFTLEYKAKQTEIFLNGQPVFHVQSDLDNDDDCFEKYKNNDFISDLIEEGMTCQDAYAEFELTLRACLRIVRESAIASKMTTDTSEERISKIYNALRIIPGGDIIEKVYLKNGNPKVIIMGYNHPLSVILEPLGGDYQPQNMISEHERIRQWAENLKKQLEQSPDFETVVAVGVGGGSVDAAGNDMIQRVIKQLETIKSKGSFVAGPIPKRLIFSP